MASGLCVPGLRVSLVLPWVEPTGWCRFVSQPQDAGATTTSAIGSPAFRP
jgi:hypothetical protein